MDELNSFNPSSAKPSGSFAPQKNLPNATTVLVLGIVSIVPGCFCFGVVGIVCGIICLILAKKDLVLYESNPGEFSVSSINNLRAGRICGIIGIILSSLYFLYLIVYFLFLGTMLSMFPWESFGK